MAETSATRMLGVQRSQPVRFVVDGAVLEAHEGEMLAAALMAAGKWRLRASPRRGDDRGAFCLMGVCQECAIFVDGQLAQACRVAVRDGMIVELKGVL